MEQPTCGSLFLSLWEKLLASGLREDAPDADYALFAMGFVAGQAEKVCSGACAAFMIRPAPYWWDWACLLMHEVCSHYGLCVYEDALHGEVWGCASEQTRAQIHRLAMKTQENSQHWHIMRAKLCGIADEHIDTSYHLRASFGARCEPEAQHE